MKRSWKKIIVIAISILVIGGIFLLWGGKKEEWQETINGFGNLEKHERDWFPINKNREYRIIGNIHIYDGNITVVYKINNKVVWEQSYEKGNYQIPEYSFGEKEGEFSIEWKMSKDIKGTYDFSVEQRQRNITKLLERMKENIVE